MKPVTKSNICGKCNELAVNKLTDGKATIKACQLHTTILQRYGWRIK